MPKQKKKPAGAVDSEVSVRASHGEPEDVFELLNKYGTYEVQPTADTKNAFPAISQGVPDAKNDESPPREIP